MRVYQNRARLPGDGSMSEMFRQNNGMAGLCGLPSFRRMRYGHQDVRRKPRH